MLHQFPGEGVRDLLNQSAADSVVFATCLYVPSTSNCF